MRNRKKLFDIMEKLLGKKIVLSGLLFAAIASFYPLLQKNEGLLIITFFDVGQGDSTLIETPDGRQILIDGGEDSSALYKLSQKLPLNDRTIDLIVLTHPHADHVGGLIPIIERYNIQAIAYSSLEYDTATYERYKLLTSLEGSSIIHPVSGDRFDLGSGIFLKVLWPATDLSRRPSEPPGSDENINNASIVLELDYADFEALLLGDAEYPVQQELLDDIGSDEQIEVLRMAHHGANNGLNRSFWELVRPNVTIISVGKNSYGHPHPAVLQYLEKQNSKTLRTDQEGDITIETDGKTWRVK